MEDLKTGGEIKAFCLKPKSGKAPRHLFVLLHGMGQNGEQIIDHFSKTLADRFPEAEILAPQGFEAYSDAESDASRKPSFAHMPNLPCLRTEHKPGELRQWFSLTVDPGSGMVASAIRRSPSLNKAFNKTVLWMRVMDSCKKVRGFVQEALKERNLDERNLVMIGYSQGGALAQYVGINLAAECAGVISHSGVFHGNAPATSRPETLLVHGLSDKIIPHTAADKSADLLKKLGIPVKIHKIESLGHRADDRSLKACADFIAERLEHMQSRQPAANREKGWWVGPLLLFKKMFD